MENNDVVSNFNGKNVLQISWPNQEQIKRNLSDIRREIEISGFQFESPVDSSVVVANVNGFKTDELLLKKGLYDDGDFTDILTDIKKKINERAKALSEELRKIYMKNIMNSKKKCK